MEKMGFKTEQAPNTILPHPYPICLSFIYHFFVLEGNLFSISLLFAYKILHHHFNTQIPLLFS
jgi:hypothetical protein